MKTSDLFLKLYIKELDVKGKDFSEAITLTGTKTESFEALDKNLSKIVVAKILKIDKHPDADKLVICQVDIGSEKIQIVTGAPNVYEGMLCPAVLVGGKVAASAHDDKEYPDGILIKEGKLRGVESHGMLCSIDELGRPADLYGDCDGILDMSNLTCKPGDDAIKVLNLNDVIYDFEITSNRIDCYSVVGIAREAAATFNKTFSFPNTKFNGSSSEKNYIDLDVKDEKLCPLFATRLIKNIKICESPDWMKTCLRAVGIRPINNIVDITNFVMMEMGQPLHAYDYDKISGHKMIIKCAKKGDKFVTLDGKERELDDTILTISDANGPIGLAGIMGGENSMITDTCKNLLLEAANFDGVNIRLSSKKIGLRTEASNLFEKGLDPNNALTALDRACALIEENGWGEIVTDFIYHYPNEKNAKRRNIEVSVKKINSLLGTSIDSSEMKKTLDKIDLITEVSGDMLKINVPTIRKDINNYADVAEEIMRFYGYDKAGESLPNISSEPKLDNKSDIIENAAYDIAIYNGFNEAMNYSFESAKVYDLLKYKKDAKERNTIKILNPLGEEFEMMRTQLINGILKSLSINYNRRNKEAKLFEIANIYLPLDKEIKVLPDERKTFILGCYGKSIDFYYIKGVAEEFIEKARIDGKISFVKDDSISYMHPGRTATIMCDDVKIGYVGEVVETVLKNYEIETKCYVAEFDLKNVIEKSNLSFKYEEISKFPSSDRDLSMTVPNNVTADKIEEIFEERGGKILKSYELFDIYEGSQVKEGYKSIAYNLTFEAKDRSLTDEEIDKAIAKILNGLNGIGIELRK